MTQTSGRIVVGLDGSPGGRAALAFALHDAARRGATLDGVTAFDTAETLTALSGSADPIGIVADLCRGASGCRLRGAASGPLDDRAALTAA